MKTHSMPGLSQLSAAKRNRRRFGGKRRIKGHCYHGVGRGKSVFKELTCFPAPTNSYYEAGKGRR